MPVFLGNPAVTAYMQGKLSPNRKYSLMLCFTLHGQLKFQDCGFTSCSVESEQFRSSQVHMCAALKKIPKVDIFTRKDCDYMVLEEG